MPFHHVSVMPHEAVDYLNCKPGDVIVDGTIGGAGHSKAICKKIFPGGMLIGVDQDMEAVEHARQALEPYGRHVQLFHANYTHLTDILAGLGIAAVGGILLDLGLSLHQITSSGRGFSFNRDEPLDMRMNATSETTASDLVNRMPQKELAQLFKTYGEERWSKAISEKIVRERKKNPIQSSARLAEIVAGVVYRKQASRPRIHPATRVFMALRIAVNRELERLESFLQTVDRLLKTGGRLCVISFHSLEDRMVKQAIRRHAAGCSCPRDFPVCVCSHRPTLRSLTRKPLSPSAAEITANPMARSARLRVAEKLAPAAAPGDVAAP